MLKAIFYLTLCAGVAYGFPVTTTLVIFFGVLGVERLYQFLFTPGNPKGAVYEYHSEP